MSKNSKKSKGKQLSYPFNAINEHQQMQQHIKDQRGINLEVESSKTSVYRKNAAGLIVKRGQPNIAHKSLPGIPAEDEETEVIQAYNEVDLEDSDDAAEVALVAKQIPKERPREHCCFRLKQLDIYGIEPGMVI